MQVVAGVTVLEPNFNHNLLLADYCWVRGGVGARNWQRGSETTLLIAPSLLYNADC